MQHFSNKTLNGRCCETNHLIYIFFSKFLSNMSILYLENWYEERLALDQDYRKNPDKRMVSNYRPF